MEDIALTEIESPLTELEIKLLSTTMVMPAALLERESTTTKWVTPVGMDVLFVARGHLDHLLGRSEPSIQDHSVLHMLH